MAANNTVTVITYNGLDGACAAAALLLRHPKATVRIGSARSIARLLHELGKEKPGKIHICGVGVTCPWEDLNVEAKRLRKAGGDLFWHCGRGYLDDRAAAFKKLATPVFRPLGSNTEAVAQYFEVDTRPEGAWLIELARYDQHLPAARAPEDASDVQRDWIDLVPASLAHYFKFQDRTPYIKTIQKLARQEFGEADRREIARFRGNGYTYLLHGDSDPVRCLKERIKRCADADRPVIITGESGTGKEHVARLLQERSRRADEAFVPVNCALFAGSVNLANSTLFGHRKGAFTGAVADRKGKFVEADGGILFLDELGELPLKVQAKLLRILDDSCVTPEGADLVEQRVDVIVVAATNSDLSAMIREGRFRADLYHRLSTLRIHVPPLRERLEDIEILVKQSLQKLAREGYGRTFGKRDFDLLRQYPWPGNVRQLTKLIDRVVLLDLDVAEALEEERQQGGLAPEPQEKDGAILLPERHDQVLAMETLQQRYARRVWELHNNNYSAAARALGVSPNTLRYTYLKEKR